MSPRMSPRHVQHTQHRRDFSNTRRGWLSHGGAVDLEQTNEDEFQQFVVAIIERLQELRDYSQRIPPDRKQKISAEIQHWEWLAQKTHGWLKNNKDNKVNGDVFGRTWKEFFMNPFNDTPDTLRI